VRIFTAFFLIKTDYVTTLSDFLDSERGSVVRRLEHYRRRGSIIKHEAFGNECRPSKHSVNQLSAEEQQKNRVRLNEIRVIAMRNPRA
jgi:hypothetical protein